MPKARPQRRPGRALPQLILLLSSSSFACAKSTYENQGRIISNLSLAHHYFFHEIDFLAMQAMILGNYHGDADNATSSSKREEKIHRLRFLEKSLIVELDYVLRLEKIALDPDEILYNAASTESCSDETTECGSDEIRFRRDTPGEMITNTISGASWTSLVTTSKSESSVTTSKSEFSYKVDHEYDYGRAMKRGFALMYDDFDCGDHARDQNNQNKPIYTPEMWRKLWEIYRDSTSFPYPIPKAHECPEEPFYEAHTTDGKGRGIFASRNITKGSLVHTGHPNTVFFLDAKSWHRFVSSLPKMFACDTMEWVWQQDVTNSGNLVLCLNLDKAAYFNDGGSTLKNNIEIKEPTSLDFYAARDIQIGQELLYDYSNLGLETHLMDL